MIKQKLPSRIWAVSNRVTNRLIANFRNWNSHYGIPQEYLSLSEHEALLEKERAKAKALVEALTSIETFCPEGRISIVPQKAIQAASQLAREALAEWTEGKKNE